MTTAKTANMPRETAAGHGAQKLRILALHGFSQDAQLFRDRIGSMRKALKSRAEFLFVDAPFKASDLSRAIPASGNAPSTGRSWWTWCDSDRPSKSLEYSGWETSLNCIREAVYRNQPVDGILGFSQGATAAALYLADSASDPSGPWFSVLVGGFLPRDDRFATSIRQADLSLPSLHVYGATDEKVPPRSSRALLDLFGEEHAQSFEHPGGHYVPTCTGEFKQVLTGYLDRVRESHGPPR
mmetsp:Transcript_24278/g.57871  ORF Transcript_24278/g.57871 Transcript_24278/m.57871 type:complete len:240 (+) Transcript_24278:44-763(+)